MLINSYLYQEVIYYWYLYKQVYETIKYIKSLVLHSDTENAKNIYKN